MDTALDTKLDSIARPAAAKPTSASPSAASPSAASPPARRRWAARILTGIPALFLTFDIVIKLLDPPEVAEAVAKLGLPLELRSGLSWLLAGCLALYLARRTAPVGAVLLTGYLGGAVLAHLRVGDPWFTHTLFPVYVGALLWAGLYLRDDRVRRLLAAR